MHHSCEKPLTLACLRCDEVRMKDLFLVLALLQLKAEADSEQHDTASEEGDYMENMLHNWSNTK